MVARLRALVAESCERRREAESEPAPMAAARVEEAVLQPLGGRRQPGPALESAAPELRSRKLRRYSSSGATPELTAADLAKLPMPRQKQMLGECLYPLIKRFTPCRPDLGPRTLAGLAGKITGMMLEMENSDLLRLLEGSAREELRGKISPGRVCH